ncbi:DUF481 domain-containing protein [Pseudomonadota bacterium]|jgi:hypothetical protein
MLKPLSQLWVIAILLLFTHPAEAARTDVVYMHNGDRVTGEIKSLFRGRLEFKTDHMGTLLIDWEDIKQVISDTGQSVELTGGQRFYGPLEKPTDPNMVAVKTESGVVGLAVRDVSAMYPVKTTFWQRLEVSFRLGFNWDKSSEVGKYNVGTSAVYRDPEFVSRIGFSSEFTTQSGRDTNSRASLNASHLRFLQNKQFRTYFGNLDHNENLGLKLRSLVGAGYGWIPIRSRHTWFSAMIGLAANREIPVQGNEQNNIEGVLGASFEYFKYAVPKKSFTSDLIIYPSLNEGGRVRAEFKTNFDIELYRDLFWGMEFYTSYDSDPITQGAETTDYGINSSVAYKF